MFGPEAAMMSGAAHLTSFVGTDTVPAIDFLEEYYGADCTKELVGCSVPATEHSVMSLGGDENELETFKKLITETYPKGIISIVSDTWDFWKVITEYLPKLKKEIMARDGKVVIRPDSGDPVNIICGDTEAIGSEYKGAVQCLWEIFSGKVNARGYKELDPHIGLIYGDSITIDRCRDICKGLEDKEFASTNVVFGIGSYTYTYTTRDQYGFAVKATYAEVDGKAKNIFKKPKTDDGTKNSAKGLTAVYKEPNGNYVLQDEALWETFNTCDLGTVFLNGQLIRETTLAKIREKLS
jgi:nicotinamide phosphoribosyltransferase